MSFPDQVSYYTSGYMQGRVDIDTFMEYVQDSDKLHAILDMINNLDLCSITGMYSYYQISKTV